MNKKKKIILLFACLSLLVFIGSTAYTYAKYFSQTKRDIGTSIKKWNIKVNDIDIKNGTTLTEGITATFTGSEHIADNTMAPTSEGVFEISLDYSEVEVSFKYEISIAENTTVPDISIYKLEVDGEEVTGTGLTISKEININTDTDTDKKKNIKVYIKWNDDETTGATLNNEQDTQVAINNTSVNFDVNLNFTQILETT